MISVSLCCTMSRAHQVLHIVDDLKHKLTDQEYKAITESLQMLHISEKKHYKIVYQLDQSYIMTDEAVSHGDGFRFSRLISLQSENTVIVKKVFLDTDGSLRGQYLQLLDGLRSGFIHASIHSTVQDAISENGYFTAAFTFRSVGSGGNFAPWAGSCQLDSSLEDPDSSDVSTTITIFKCEPYMH